ncbi:Gfo/Idh/MocA family protein [Aneurinibacillus sp. REN35]|uniref:Gfo/Idh/MocA family protein n=1 Tax=Aneurinibacillus sp. REN35 TaxID=3237286 RepID=UPI00352883FB
MEKPLCIGMIGLDTSHCEAFTSILNDPRHPYHVPGGRITVGFPGGSPDFELSSSRIDSITHTLHRTYGIRMASSLESVAEQCDAILLTSVDGRAHLAQFQRIAPYQKPVFIDKPLAVDFASAQRIAEIAEEYNVPLMSCSSLRFSSSLEIIRKRETNADVTGAYCFGPMPLQATQPGLFWYGIHSVEMLFTVLGPECLYVTAAATDDSEAVIGVWKDGRIGTIRGYRTWNNAFGAVIHKQDGAEFVDIQADAKPYYAGLLEHVLPFFNTGIPAVEIEETLQIVRFIEAANKSRATGSRVFLEK